MNIKKLSVKLFINKTISHWKLSVILKSFRGFRVLRENYTGILYIWLILK